MKTAMKIALAGASAIAFTAPGYAQTATGDEIYDANNDEGIANTDVIIVEGRRRAEDQQDVPSVINVVTQEDFQKLNIRDGEDVASIVPGLQLETANDGFGGTASIRGVNFEVRASGTNPTVEFYQNDAVVPAQVFFQPNYDIGQVEVLRGPQGTLRGRATPSGSITIRTRRPDLYDFGGYVDATGTDLGTINFNGAVGIPIVEGVLGIRVAGLFEENEANRVTTINNNGSLTDGRDPLSRNRSGRISAVFNPADWLELFGSYQKIDRDDRYFEQYSCFPTTAACTPDIDPKDRKSITDQPYRIASEYDVYNGTATFKFGGQNLIYTGNYVDQNVATSQPLDEGNVLTGGVILEGANVAFVPGPSISGGTPRAVAEYFQNTVAESYYESHEIRLQNDERLFDGLLDYVVGGMIYKTGSDIDLERDNLAFAGAFLLNPVIPLAFQNGPIEVARFSDNKEKSVFGNITLHPTNALELSAGLRYIDYKSQNQTIIPDTGINSTNRIADDHVVYQASASYDISNDLMVYASFGTSYRPPTDVVGCFNPNCFDNPELAQFNGTDAETSESYEIGFKSTLFDRLRLNVTAYHQDFENYLYRAPGVGAFYLGSTAPGAAGTRPGYFNFVSGVPVEVNGVEAEIAYEFSKNFNLGATLSYADGKIKGGTIPCTDFNNDGVPDNFNTSSAALAGAYAGAGDDIRSCEVDQRSSFAAPFQASVFGEFTAPLNDDVGFFLRGLFDFTGNSKGDPNNRFDDVDSYGLLNLYTGVRDPDGGWEVTAFAKNIFDTYRVLTRDGRPSESSYTDLLGGVVPNSPTTGYGRITSTSEREFGVNVRFKFGADK